MKNIQNPQLSAFERMKMNSVVIYVTIQILSYLIALILLFAANIPLRSTLPGIIFLIILLGISYFLIKSSNKGLKNDKLSWLSAFIFTTTIIITKYNYAYNFGWDFTIQSYNSTFFLIFSVILSALLFNKRLYKLLAIFALVNWIFIIIMFYQQGNNKWIAISETGTIQGAFITREVFVFLLSIIIWIAIYIFMIGIENFSKQTTKQQLIIEEHNLLLEKKIEERTVELKTKNEIMLKELELARNIQNQLIPNRSPREFIFSLYSPMEMVGGDFFDFINFQNQNKIGIFISDVSGHGVPAAFITSMLKGTIHQSGDKINNPSELLLHINDALKNQTDGNFITAFYGIYDTSNKSFLYSSAGHNQPYVFNNNQADMLSGKKGIPLTTMSNEFLKSINKSYVNNEITLPSNSKLLLYTDGLTEATSKNDINIDFENSVMSNILMKNADKKSDEFIKTLFDKLIEFRGCLNFEDDVCLICMDIK